MKRRRFGATLFASGASLAVGCNGSGARARSKTARFVSLSPAVTETLFALDLGAQLVGVSDYCRYPEAARRLPRTGTALSPNYEAIARLSPTLMLCEAADSVPRRELTALAATRFLPWLSLEDVVASTRLIGALTASAPQAERLADKLWHTLAVAEVASAPRVLAVLGDGMGVLHDIYFIKKNSIHGAALRAAGAKNAIPDDVAGVPRLSVERLLRVDPDAILVLVDSSSPSASAPAAVAPYLGLEPLTAGKKGRISALVSGAAFSDGPRILTLVGELEHELTRLFGAPASRSRQP